MSGFVFTGDGRAAGARSLTGNLAGLLQPWRGRAMAVVLFGPAAASVEHEQHDGHRSDPPGLQQARKVPGERASPCGTAVTSENESTHRRAPSTDTASALS